MRIKKSDEKSTVSPLAGPTKSVLAGPPVKLAGPPGKLAGPARPLGGLRPPPGGPRRLAPPGKTPNMSMSVSRIKADDLSIRN